MSRRCRQCWRDKPDAEFIGRGGRVVLNCAPCRERMASHGTDRWVPKGRPLALVASSRLRVRWVARSGNRKTGPIPSTITSAVTCPRSCAFYGDGCYAEVHVLAQHWAGAEDRGLLWAEFCARVAELPEGQLWRHNEAGDLPGAGDVLDVRRLARLVEANRGRRGFTFTHKPLRRPLERGAVRRANAAGFTINLSADSLAHADELAALGVGPVAVVLPRDASPRSSRTPAGRTVVVCPAQTAGLTCDRCRLCAKPERQAIVGFRAHGQLAGRVTELVQLRRPA